MDAASWKTRVREAWPVHPRLRRQLIHPPHRGARRLGATLSPLLTEAPLIGNGGPERLYPRSPTNRSSGDPEMDGAQKRRGQRRKVGKASNPTEGRRS
jgi:hypothetical protein